MDVSIDLSTMCLALRWAYTDQSDVLSALLKLAPHELLSWAVAAGLTTVSQRIGCESTGLESWSAQRQGIQVEDHVWQAPWMETQKCAWHKDKDLWPSFIYTLVLQEKCLGLKAYEEPLLMEKLSLKTRFRCSIRDLESGGGVGGVTCKPLKLANPLHKYLLRTSARSLW